MHKGKFPTFSHSILVVIILLVGVAGLWAADQTNGDQNNDSTAIKRPDLILIDSLADFGPLERPAVAFLHDKHTQVVEKQNKDCLACHQENDGKLSPKFKRTKNTNRQDVMTIYHSNCITCHVDTAGKGKESGPITCGECHQKDNKIVSTRRPMGFDKSLHYRHVQAQEKKCELCHHEYNAKTKKLFYAKGKEGTCRYCHEEKTEENRISMQLASHEQCLNCHRKKLAENIHAGPIHCQGCHSEKGQKKIEKVADVPRMERDQPDAVLIRAAADAKPTDIPGERVAPVAFNHKAHEGYNDTCQVCHHASMAACTSCHTPTGTKDGQNIGLNQAMHQRDADPSCIGCHAAKQTSSKKCSGCHSGIKADTLNDSSTCKACHAEDPEKMQQPMTKEEAAAMAAKLIAFNEPAAGTYDLNEIPEKVVIKKLSDQYQPVELPHRKIITKLVENIKDDKLAGYFHTDPGTLCQGCHHNSPASKTPPDCGSCHGQPFNTSNPERPGLMGAYHEQCLTCHAKMGIEKPASRDCTACHPKKTS